MTFADFQAAVNDCLGPEAQRRGLEAYRAQHQRNALIKLQKYIPGYRTANGTQYLAANMTVESCAMVGQLPAPGCQPQAFYILSNAPGDDGNCKRYRLDPYPWSRRQDIVCGRLDFRTWWGAGACAGGPCPPFPPFQSCTAVGDTSANPWNWCCERAYVYSIAPHASTFLIYPKLNPYDTLLLLWDGYKTVFNPTDIVPYPVEASEAVSAYILSKVHRYIDRNVQLSQSDLGDFQNQLRDLYRTWQDSRVAQGLDDEYAANLVAPPATSFIAGGAQAIPFLQNISQLLGTTGNALQWIPTAGLVTLAPFQVYISINGITEKWTLKLGADATNAPEGIVQPLDWATSGLVWYEANP